MLQVIIRYGYIVLWALILGFSSQGLSKTKPLPLEMFTKDTEFRDIKLSPDGKHLAATIPKDNQIILIIINRKQNAIVRAIRFTEDRDVRYFHWANNERLVYGRSKKVFGREQGVHYGQIFAANIDGSQQINIFGYRGGKRKRASSFRSNGNQGSERAFGEIISLLPDDPKHILITAHNWDNDEDATMRIVRLNIYNSKKKTITRTPYGNMTVITNANGAIVSATGFDRKGHQRSYLYKDRSWIEIDKNHELNQLVPVYSNDTGDKLYMLSHPQSKTDALFEFNTQSGKLTQRLQHEQADIRDILLDPITGSVIGAKVMPNYMEYLYLDENHWYSQIHKALVKLFTHDDISVTSMSADHKEMIVSVANDKSPNTFYIYNREDKSIKFLLKSKPWIDSKQMAARLPVSFQSRDNQTIHGYLTLPNGASKDNQVPLVTLVHGGPYGEQDEWMFDTQAQMLANNGYAVMQVNFRGSGGYGLIYEEVAYQKRHSLIQQDIIDGTLYAQSRPEIAKNKACIMGTSFGGYSAVMAPTIKQDLFKCSITIAGPYNLVTQYEEADYSSIDSTRSLAAIMYGSDKTLLSAQSPINHLDKFNIPVLIVHGGKDERVPPEQAFELKAALDKANKPYQWLYKKSEGHGFYNEKNRMELYQQSLEFLAKHLK